MKNIRLFSSRFAFTAFLMVFAAGIAFAAAINDPTDLIVTGVSSASIDLAWNDNSNNEDGHKIERSSDGVNFSEIDQVGQNVETYSDSGLSESTGYHYRVRAFRDKKNGTEYTGYSNTVSATTTSSYAQASYYSQGEYYSQGSYYSQGYYQSGYYSQGYYQSGYYSQGYYQGGYYSQGTYR